ncbi:MAG: outer membrane beta-barrel protein [Bacteroidia bacterium]
MRRDYTYTSLFGSLLLFFVLIGNTAFSQSSGYAIAGVVEDQQGTPIQYGNAVLLSPEDSTFIMGVIVQQGSFRLEQIKETPVLLRLTALSFEPLFVTIKNEEQETAIQVETLKMAPLQMKDVVITARKPLVVQRGTDVVVNVANTSLSSIGTAIDVLRSAPKVVLNSGGQITVLGKGNAIIYIDGQRTANPQVLQTLSSHDIKAIEIIENPSARYDAEGNAVIHIITKKGSQEGYRIGFIQEAEQGRFFRSYHKLDAYVRLSKLMLQGSYGYRPYKRRGREQYNRGIGEEINIDNKLLYSRRTTNHEFNLKGTYALGERHHIGFDAQRTITDGLQQSDNRNIFTRNQDIDFILDTHIEAPFEQQNTNLNGFYEWQMDSAGSKLVFTAQQAWYGLERNESIGQELYQKAVESTMSRRSRNQNDIQLRVAQVDGTHMLKAGNSLQFGLKHAHINNGSSLNFENRRTDGTYISDPGFSNAYSYEETINAAYGEWIFANKKVNGRLGLRSAWTRSEGLSETQELFTRDYLDFFPNASLSTSLGKNSKLSISYNYRIQRPQFQDLNPFVWYADSLVSLQGNANLRPGYSHLLDAGWTWKGWNIKANYTRIKDNINTIIKIQDPENPAVFAFVRDNIDQVNNYMISISRSFSIGAYSAFWVIGGRTESHRYRDLGALVTNQKAGFYIYTNQSLRLPGKILLEALYSYSSPGVDGIYTDKPVQYLNLGLSRSFWNKHLHVRLHANDVFDTYRFRGTAQVNNDDWTYLSEGDWHFIKLAVTWDFGGFSKGNLRQRKGSDTEAKRVSRM